VRQNGQRAFGTSEKISGAATPEIFSDIHIPVIPPQDVPEEGSIDVFCANNMLFFQYSVRTSSV